MNKKKIEKGVKQILEGIGADLKRKDIATTPKRVADMYEEILGGELKDPYKELEVILEQKVLVTMMQLFLFILVEVMEVFKEEKKQE